VKTSLPRFEGQHVKAARLKLSGHSDERIGALANEEEIYLIVRGVVADVAHGNVSNVFTRTHKVKATAAILLDRDQGARILDEAAMLADERFDIPSLFNQRDDGADDDGSDK
jgi:hypothetical protein